MSIIAQGTQQHTAAQSAVTLPATSPARRRALGSCCWRIIELGKNETGKEREMEKETREVVGTEACRYAGEAFERLDHNGLEEEKGI